jgi:hypothetical protein
MILLVLSRLSLGLDICAALEFEGLQRWNAETLYRKPNTKTCPRRKSAVQTNRQESRIHRTAHFPPRLVPMERFDKLRNLQTIGDEWIHSAIHDAFYFADSFALYVIL